MRMFDDLLVRLWINSVELQKVQFQWLLSHTGVNFVKSLFKGQHKRLDDANPIRDLNDSRILWMVSFVSWLDNWKTYSNTNNTACLTNENNA